MKNQIQFFIILCFISLAFSCKKDFDFDEEPFIPTEFISPFRANGTIVDLENDTTFNTSIEKENTDENTNTLNPNITYSTSDIGLESTTNTKFALSYTGTIRSGLNGNIFTDVPILPFIINGIVVKIVSDRPSNFNLFSKAELLELFDNESFLSFGSDPGQVEISMHHVKSFDNLGNLSYSGSTRDINDVSEFTFEILNVEEYIQDDERDPVKALLVTANINCNLIKSLNDDFTVSDFDLVDFEAVFFFEYE